MRKLSLACLFFVSMMLALIGPPSAAMAASGAVHINIVKAGFIVGVSGGNGSLRYAGRLYPLSIGGVSLGATIGLSKVELVGSAQGLHDPSDIEGVYSGAGAGLAIAGGGRIAKLTNSKGVVLMVKGRQVGFMFSVDLSGMQVSLKK